MHKQLEHTALATVAVLHVHQPARASKKWLSYENKYEHLLGKVYAQVIRASSFVCRCSC